MFSEAKFKSLKKTSQHKKIAELLKSLYFNFDLKDFQHVLQLEKWLGCPYTTSYDLEALSNGFHRHLNETGLGISEHSLLIKEQDRTQPLADWLSPVIYLDHLRSAHNIGNILRTVEAFRLGKVCFSPQMPNLDHPAVQKTSMGAHTHIETVPYDLDTLPKPLIAVETHHKAIPIEEFTFPNVFTLALGNEEYGLSHQVLQRADVIVEVPLVGCKNSLNVASCMSILAWKIRGDCEKKGRR